MIVILYLKRALSRLEVWLIILPKTVKFISHELLTNEKCPTIYFPLSYILKNFAYLITSYFDHQQEIND